MKKNKKRPSILIPLFWGSLWGIAEATLGHLLHISKIPGLAGSLMFPIALFFMVKAYSMTGRHSTILFTSCAAASLKFFDIFISPHDLFSVLNPMISILCESLVLVLFLKAWKKQLFSKFLPVFTLVLGWKLIYSTVIFSLSHLFTVKSFFDLGSTRFLSFFIVESLASSLIVFLFFKVQPFSFKSSFYHPKKIHYFLTAGVYILAVFIETMV
ncbi:MAG TPA: hypothetical protein VFG01_12545 [Acidobacteriota bacterium]|nr:hypothetical protein [Acidobacteriota bacterium]